MVARRCRDKGCGRLIFRGLSGVRGFVQAALRHRGPLVEAGFSTVGGVILITAFPFVVVAAVRSRKEVKSAAKGFYALHRPL